MLQVLENSEDKKGLVLLKCGEESIKQIYKVCFLQRSKLIPLRGEVNKIERLASKALVKKYFPSVLYKRDQSPS